MKIGIAAPAVSTVGGDHLSVSEAARRLRVRRQTVQVWIERGVLPTVPVQVEERRIPVEAVERYARERKPRGRPRKGASE